MKCKLSKDELRDALARVVKVCAKSDNVPVLGHLRITAFKGDHDALEIVGSNIQTTITAIATEVEVKKEGAVLIPAAHAWRVISAMSGDVELTALANHRTRMKTSSSAVHISGMSPLEYVTVPGLPDIDITIDGAELLGMMTRVIYAISTDDSRGTFCGALLKVTDGRLEMVATDGHCLAKAHASGAYDAPDWIARGAVIPRDALAEILRSISTSASVQLGYAHNRVSIMQRGTVITTSLIEGRFPDFSQVIKRGTNSVTVDATAFKRGAKLAMTADETAVSVASGGAQLRVSSILDTSDAEAHVECSDVTGSFEFLADGRKLIAPCGLMGANMAIAVTDATSPVIVEDPSDSSHTHVIMPRVK